MKKLEGKKSKHIIAALLFLPVFILLILLGNGTDNWDKGVQKTKKIVFRS
tara:strand:+ start:80 stop:229 length:150 start_codon:yes stop_codon:yes gene_type:complete